MYMYEYDWQTGAERKRMPGIAFQIFRTNIYLQSIQLVRRCASLVDRYIMKYISSDCTVDAIPPTL